jgi:hypothetical protein
MSSHRAILVAFTTLFAAGMTSAAFAGCGGCGGSLAVTYAPLIEYAPPVAYAPAIAYAPPPVEYAPPVAYGPPIAVAPIAVNNWDTGGGCGCGRSVVYAQPVAPAPIYVVNQAPDYTGPGIMVPYGTYSPEAGYAAPYGYPYISGPGYRYGYGMPYRMHHRYRHSYYGAGPRYAYRERVSAHPHHYRAAPLWHRYY